MKSCCLSLFFLSLFLILLPIDNVHANGSHHHGISSPFDKQKDQNSHCELNKHHLANNECPHRNAGKNIEKSLMISLDCKGKTAGSNPTLGSYSGTDFSFNWQHFNIELVLIAQWIDFAPQNSKFFLSERIDHPPQTI